MVPVAPRVLHVCEPTHAGAARVTLNLALGLRARGVDSVVCTPPGQLAEWCTQDGVELLELRFERGSARTYVPAMRTVSRAARSGDYALVHAHSSFSGVLARLPRRSGFPPVVFQPHAWSFLALTGAASRAAVAVERLLARRTDLLICVSDEELEAGRERGIRPARAVVIPNGIRLDESLGHPRPATRPVAPLLGSIGRLSAQKGMDVLIRALASPGCPAECRLEIVGEGDERGALEELATDLGVGDRVALLGQRAGVADCLRRWDLFVGAPRYEGAPLALLEAIGAGLPVVTTDVAGTRRVLEGDGRIVPVDDPAALAAAVAETLSSWTDAIAGAERARRRVLREYDLDTQIARTLAAYQTLTPAFSSSAVTRGTEPARRVSSAGP